MHQGLQVKTDKSVLTSVICGEHKSQVGKLTRSWL